jgi:hypothetical protein
LPKGKGGDLLNGIYLSVSFYQAAPDLLVFHIPYCNDDYPNYYSKKRINIKIGNEKAIIYKLK